MFKGIRFQWGCTLLGCIAAFVPVSLVFYLYRAKIGEKSKFANALIAQENEDVE
jgi:hypothetical protein